MDSAYQGAHTEHLENETQNQNHIRQRAFIRLLRGFVLRQYEINHHHENQRKNGIGCRPKAPVQVPEQGKDRGPEALKIFPGTGFHDSAFQNKPSSPSFKNSF
jgi:hypothetical protein